MGPKRRKLVQKILNLLALPSLGILISIPILVMNSKQRGYAIALLALNILNMFIIVAILVFLRLPGNYEPVCLKETDFSEEFYEVEEQIDAPLSRLYQMQSPQPSRSPRQSVNETPTCNPSNNKSELAPSMIFWTKRKSFYWTLGLRIYAATLPMDIIAYCLIQPYSTPHNW